jgi:3-hydroxyisobutyrate dehydrogenase-like beta-hydroxyacid dehydrogenase
MTAIAVIGLGAMGGRIAARLVASGHEVVVWNRSPERVQPLVDLGARPADTPGDATDRADGVITMVSDPPALREVTEGPRGIVEAADGSTTVLQMSTVDPAAVARLESVLPSEAGLLDVPVLGSLKEAESGSLRLFAGGASSLVERWTPELETLGTVVPVGPVGAGTAAKLVANSTLLGTLGQLAETLSLAQALGLPRHVAFDVLSTTPLAAQAERRRGAVESGEYPLHFSLRLAGKDGTLIENASELDLRVSAAAASWFDEADEAGWGDLDYSTILAYVLGEDRPSPA